ncbi:MAG: nucleotidyltransferase family protein [Methylococcales bacterium]|nr:nucleotidyltransferase family protein [Methylococcales bacterium]
MTSNWQKIRITSCTSLQKTIEVIDQGALQIALVVDDQDKLVGVVTDGDIRRALIKGIALTSAVNAVMNPNPKVATAEASKAQLIAVMEKYRLFHLPIVDTQGILLGLETLQALYKQPQFENPVFLMAGGFGRRLHPFTDTCPKPMLHVGGKPILETIIEQFVAAGFKHFYIAVHYLASQIKSYFGDGERWGVSITYVDEHEPLGTAGALGLLPDDLPDIPMIVMNGDILTQIDFPRLLSFHIEHQGIATLCVRNYEHQIPFGVVEFNNQAVTAIIEKPIHSCFTSAGVYVLNHALVNAITAHKKLDMPDLLNQHIQQHALVTLFPVHEYWMDIGQKADFLRAQGDFSTYF